MEKNAQQNSHNSRQSRPPVDAVVVAMSHSRLDKTASRSNCQSSGHTPCCQSMHTHTWQRICPFFAFVSWTKSLFLKYWPFFRSQELRCAEKMTATGCECVS